MLPQSKTIKRTFRSKSNKTIKEKQNIQTKTNKNRCMSLSVIPENKTNENLKENKQNTKQNQSISKETTGVASLKNFKNIMSVAQPNQKTRPKQNKPKNQNQNNYFWTNFRLASMQNIRVAHYVQ